MLAVADDGPYLVRTDRRPSNVDVALGPPPRIRSPPNGAIVRTLHSHHSYLSRRSHHSRVSHGSLHASLLARLAVITITAVVTLVAATGDANAMRRVRVRYPGMGTAPSMEAAIARTWPKHLHRSALNVAWCESRGNARARNGQYRGHFQMGRNEWRKFGAGNPFNAVDNSAAAYRYYRAVGSWRPWQCQP